ncbi:hypothetical protein [Pedobacter alpinus]|uniref:DUF748 domain-containing protein n=1 Tax=Pedobacter alpinus TaxID=1590643 RepID=A0ABW5TQS7_9SPHI
MDETSTTPKKKHKTIKWIFALLGIITIIALGAAWYINKKWKPLLTNAIQNTLIDASDSLYTVKFSDIKVNILVGNVTVDSIELIPNLDVYDKLKAKRIAPENIFRLKIYKLSLKNIKPFKVYREKKLDIKNITLQNPELTVFYTKLKNQIQKKEDNRTPYQRIKNTLKELKITSIFLTDVKFKYVDQSYEKPKITSFDQMNIRLNDILIDSLAQYDSTRIFSTKDIIAEINNYSYATPDSMYKINIKHAFVSSQNKQFKIGGIALEPRLKEMAFTNSFKRQQERYKLSFDSVLVNNIDFNQLIDKRTIKSSKVSLLNGNLAVFLDRGKPAKLIDKGKNFPHLALRRINWDIIADTIVIKNTNISYAEYNPKTEAKGTLYLKNLNGRIFNITNDSLALTKNGFANAYLQTYLMGKGKLDINIRFNLTDAKGGFSYKGTLGSMDMTVLNSLTKPLAMLSTNTGKVNSMEFDIKGNVDGAKGKVILRYEDLNISIMKKDDENDKLKKSGLVSLIANALLVDNANPKGKDPLKVAYPSYSRPKEGSFFNLMWKTIFEGLKVNVGITKEREDNLKKRADNFSQAKADREERKEKRIKRREERKNK